MCEFLLGTLKSIPIAYPVAALVLTGGHRFCHPSQPRALECGGLPSLFQYGWFQTNRLRVLKRERNRFFSYSETNCAVLSFDS